MGFSFPTPAFPSTHWSQLVAGEDPAVRARAVHHLASEYWQPICLYIQRKWSKPQDEAADLTQGFFVWILETDFLGRADPTRGRLRAFVRVALGHYLGQEHRKSRRMKRGSGRLPLSLGNGATPAIDVPDPRVTTPEERLDHEWRAALLARAAARLAERLTAEGRPEVYATFAERYLNDLEVEPSYDAIAARLGLSRATVSNHLQRGKALYREILRALVAETVTDPRALADEYHELFGGTHP